MSSPGRSLHHSSRKKEKKAGGLLSVNRKPTGLFTILRFSIFDHIAKTFFNFYITFTETNVILEEERFTTLENILALTKLS